MANIGKVCLTDDFIQDHKNDCSGCHACFNVCPVHAISMRADKEGFLYPSIDEKVCIHCGLCGRVCQILNKRKPIGQIPVETYACMNRNEEERMKSSSGGIFILLAKYVIAQGGYVFGAAFNERMELRHTYSHTVEGCKAFMGSKYVQSRIGTSYGDAKKLLNAGKLVLFSGTPCQIHGLKLYLQREYKNLITVDLACHGVPSPLVFARYVEELECKYQGKMEDFSFRSKEPGWKHFSSRVCFDNGKVYQRQHGYDSYMKGFLGNIDLRPRCYQCANKGDNRYADITLGDYWGVEGKNPEIDDDKGISVALIYTGKGKEYLSKISEHMVIQRADFNYVIQHNSAIMESVSEPEHRMEFFHHISENKMDVSQLVSKYFPAPSILLRIKRKVKNIIKKSLGGGNATAPLIGWKQYHLQALFSNGKIFDVFHGDSLYMKGFLGHLYLRPCCHCCDNKGDFRFSDLTLADFWGVEGTMRDMDDNKGTSIVLVHTDRGKEIMDMIRARSLCKEADWKYVVDHNPCLIRSVSCNNSRELFFENFVKVNS